MSRNYTSGCWVLKCDIKKFFASIDQGILLSVLDGYIPDKKIMRLLQEIVESVPHGLPLGNLTSQLFANVYMNIFDQWVKHSFLGILKHGHAQKIKQEVLGQYWLWKL